MERNQQILECIKAYMLTHNYPPSVEEITLMVGFKSKSTTYEHLCKMKDMGMIDFEASVSRSITVPGIKYVEV